MRVKLCEHERGEFPPSINITHTDANKRGLASAVYLEVPDEQADTGTRLYTDGGKHMTYIYIVTPNGDEAPCKVGISENPESRLASLQCGSPVKLVVRETYWLETRAEALAMERLFHDSYTEWRMSGEWFGISFEDANYWLFENVIWVPENLGRAPRPELSAQYEIMSRPELRLA